MVYTHKETKKDFTIAALACLGVLVITPILFMIFSKDSLAFTKLEIKTCYLSALDQPEDAQLNEFTGCINSNYSFRGPERTFILTQDHVSSCYLNPNRKVSAVELTTACLNKKVEEYK